MYCTICQQDCLLSKAKTWVRGYLDRGYWLPRQVIPSFLSIKSFLYRLFKQIFSSLASSLIQKSKKQKKERKKEKMADQLQHTEASPKSQNPNSLPWDPNNDIFPLRHELPTSIPYHPDAPADAAWVWGENDNVCCVLFSFSSVSHRCGC